MQQSRFDKEIPLEPQKMETYQVDPDNVFRIDVRSLHKKEVKWKTKHSYFENSLYQKMVEHVQNLLPEISERWLAVKEELDRNPIRKINLTKDEFRKRFAKDFNETALAGVLDYLEFSGNIIKFPEPSTLSDYVFPNPPFLSDWLYQDVLNEKFKDNDEGVLDYAKLKERIGENKAWIFREIMDEFHLLFVEKGNVNHLVVPQFLPENKNASNRFLLDLVPYAFSLRFTDFFHESRMFQFISEFGLFADDKTSYWRYGLIFTIQGVKSLVYFDNEEREILIHLEDKTGKIGIAQSLFDYFVTKGELSLERVLYKGKNHVADQLAWQDFKRQKPNTNDLIEGAQLSVNQKNYIDIKETLRSNAEEISIGIDVKSYQKIKLNNLTINLLGLMNQQLKKIFISYSKDDELYKIELKKHFVTLIREGKVSTFDDRQLSLGGEWDSEIRSRIDECDIMICLISVDFLTTDYIIDTEIPRALEMGKIVVPIIVRPCDWNSSVLGGQNGVLKGKEISLFKEEDDKHMPRFRSSTREERDMQWLNVVKEFRAKAFND